MYDQAQSARLGQRVPPETTYVQIFDVDPATVTADLVEAAWPGMLVFRQDLGILQIYNGTEGAWQSVAGGVAGQLTYVGPEMPVKTPPDTFTVGDVWYDSDDQMKPYVWDGDSWEPSAGLHTFVGPPTPVSLSIGDIWFNVDEGHRQYWAAIAGADRIGDGFWQPVSVSVSENIADIAALQSSLLGLSSDLELVSQAATAAGQAADLASSKITISELDPGTDATGYPDGALWLTRDLDQVVGIFELFEGSWTPRTLGADVLSGLDLDQLLSGSLDGSRITDHSIGTAKLAVTTVTASEALPQGSLVHVWSSSGYKARLASSTGYEAHGFVLSAVASGGVAQVHHTGTNPYLSSPPGSVWLGTAGGVSATPPSGVGVVLQRVGVAPAAGVLNFMPTAAIRIT